MSDEYKYDISQPNKINKPTKQTNILILLKDIPQVNNKKPFFSMNMKKVYHHYR